MKKISPSEIDYARLATFIDSEGSIAAYATKRKDNPKINDRYTFMIGVTNTSPLLIDWLLSKSGGSIYVPKGNALTKKTIIRWNIHSKEASLLLKAAMPYFIIKGRQAQLAVEFYSTFSLRPRREKISDEVVIRRRAIICELKRLNNLDEAKDWLKINN